MLLRQISDPKLAQYAYLVGCQRTKEALIIDPQRDVDRYLELAAAEDLSITAVTETHIHADFLSGARELAEQTGAMLFLSDEGDANWKYQWVERGTYDVTLLEHGDRFRVGNIELQAMHTPGHTPEHLSFLVIDRGSGVNEPIGLISGDFVFVGDLGRPDLLETAAGVAGAMEPSAQQLYTSVQQFLQLPDYVQVWPGHGAGSACGKALGAVPTSTVGYESRANGAIDAATRGADVFVAMILQGQPEPPLYFARMKQLNKEGVPLLGELPKPNRVSGPDLTKVVGQEQTVILDTRLDRRAFMDCHIRGSLYTPRNKTFPTIAGSYVRSDEQIYLIVEEEHLDEMVRDLVRIGLDNIAGFAPPSVLETMEDLRTTPVIGFREVEAADGNLDFQVLDVRGAAEYQAQHLPGAANIAHTRLLARLDELSADQQWWVHCASGARAAAASALLEREGFEVSYIDDLFANANASVQQEAALVEV